MGKLTASMVVDLEDRTGRKVQTIIGNLDRLKRAERDHALAQSGVHLSRKDRAMERLMMENERQAEEHRTRIATWASRGSVVALAGGAAASMAYKNFADVERRINRIVINADKGAEAIQPTISKLQQVGDSARLGFDEVVSGLDALIASGRSLDEAMAFLPSISMTAQASGTAISDLALSADALAGSLEIDPTSMQRALDILVAGGKMGKFEAKEMSQYLPSLLPAFSALGYKGTDGLQRIIAMMQIMRNQAGSSGEAATYLGNVLNKMYSADTAKKFKSFGVDLPKALDAAKKEGRDLFEVFLDMTQLATKGDLSKLPLLFTDAEMQKGVRALLTQRDALDAWTRALGKVDGTALKDFNQVAEDSASKIQRLSNLWDKFATQVGAGVADFANPVLDTVTQRLDDRAAELTALEKLGAMYENTRREFFSEFKRQNPKASSRDAQESFGDGLRKYGRGETVTPLAALNEGRRVREAQQQYREKQAATSRGRHNDPYYNGLDVYRQRPYAGQVPVPISRPGDDDRRAQRQARAYRHGTPSQNDGPDVDPFELLAAEEARRVRRRTMAAFVMEGARGARAAGLGGTTDTSPGKAADDLGVRNTPAMQEVKLSGTPTVITQPSGVQQVQVMNPIRPNISVSVSLGMQQAVDPLAVGREVGRAVAAEVLAAHRGGGDHGF